MMSSTAEEDPFLQVQSELLQTLTQTRPLFTSFLRIRSLAPSSSSSTSMQSSPELLSARRELLSNIESLKSDLEDLKDSLEAIERDSYRFGLEIEEVVRRKRVVESVGGEVEDMEGEVGGAVKDGVEGERGRQKRGNVGKGAAPSQTQWEEEEENHGLRNEEQDRDYNAEFEQQQQKRMFEEQDQMLGEVSITVGNLRQQAGEMGRELEEQAEMLDEVDGVVDRVGGRLRVGMKKMEEVSRSAEERWGGCCIWVLVGVLILLLVLVLVL